MSTIKVNALRHTGGSSDNISLDSSGNVGIGVATPTDYNGNADNLVVGATSGSNGITVATGTTGDGSLFFADGTTGTAEYAGYVQYNHNNNYLRFGSASTEALRLDSSQNLLFNSGYGSVATAYGVRAWIYFNGESGSIGSGLGSGNISTVTDHGTGDYTISFSNSMPDANYAAVGGLSDISNNADAGFLQAPYSTAPTTSAFRLRTVDSNYTAHRDCQYVYLAFIR